MNLPVELPWLLRISWPRRELINLRRKPRLALSAELELLGVAFQGIPSHYFQLLLFLSDPDLKALLANRRIEEILI